MIGLALAMINGDNRVRSRTMTNECIDRLSRRRVMDLSAAELADAMNLCFEDYVIPFRLTPELADRRFRRDSLDGEASTVWRVGDDPAAVTLIARRGWTCRLAAMGVAKPFRRQGVGRFVMETCVNEARARSDRRFVLEVIEQNPAAIGLYEAVGFSKSRRLVGYQRSAGLGDPVALLSVDPSFVCRQVARHGPPDLPWELNAMSLGALGPPTRGFELAGVSWSLVTPVSHEKLILWTVLTLPANRRHGLGRRMIEGLQAEFPGHAIVTPVAVPDDLSPGFMREAGFEDMAISQFEMAMNLG